MAWFSCKILRWYKICVLRSFPFSPVEVITHTFGSFGQLLEKKEACFIWWKRNTNLLGASIFESWVGAYNPYCYIYKEPILAEVTQSMFWEELNNFQEPGSHSKVTLFSFSIFWCLNFKVHLYLFYFWFVLKSFPWLSWILAWNINSVSQMMVQSFQCLNYHKECFLIYLNFSVFCQFLQLCFIIAQSSGSGSGDIGSLVFSCF